MKKIIFLTLSFIAFSSFAQDQNVKSENVISLDKNDIEAIISKDDVYVRPIDIEEGIEFINGVHVQDGRVFINMSKPSQLDVGKILLQNGREARVLSGGNAGGG